MVDKTLYDAAVVGAGQGGGPLAAALARAGWRTALIEREHIGGTCVNKGCTPTKTMVASARIAHLAGRAADYGVETSGVTVNMETVRRRKRDIVEMFREGSRRSAEQTTGLDVVMGEAVFSGAHELEVRLKEGGGMVLGADRVFINTGARPAMPPIEGLADLAPLDSTSVMELGEVPEHLVVIGGGYVGLEFGQMFRRFGAGVTIVQRGGQLLSGEDEDVAEEMATILRDEGVDVLLKAEAVGVEKTGDDTIRLTVRQDGSERAVTGSHLLVAAGRKPNTDGLNTPAAGIDLDEQHHVIVDSRLQTNVDGVYAMGDVKGGPAFTHVSYDDYRILRANLLEGGSETTENRMVPYAVFTDPQLGRFGMSEAEARRRGRSVKVAKMPMNRSARALETDETRGFMKAVVDAADGRILGCAVLGAQGAEIAAVIQVAMMGGVPYTALRDGMFAHPTYAESLNNLFTTVDQEY